MIWSMSEDDFEFVVSVHLKGHWNMCPHAAQYMREAGSGLIANFSSDAFKGSVERVPLQRLEGPHQRDSRARSPGKRRVPRSPTLRFVRAPIPARRLGCGAGKPVLPVGTGLRPHLFS